MLQIGKLYPGPKNTPSTAIYFLVDAGSDPVLPLLISNTLGYMDIKIEKLSILGKSMVC